MTNPCKIVVNGNQPMLLMPKMNFWCGYWIKFKITKLENAKRTKWETFENIHNRKHCNVLYVSSYQKSKDERKKISLQRNGKNTL